MKANNGPKSKQKILLFVWIIANAALLTGCCCTGRSPAVVIVPEAVFRTETTIADRIRLKLMPEGRQSITNFIRFGGNWKNQGGTPATADAMHEMEDVAPVLDFLAANVLFSDQIKTNGVAVLTKYFGKTYTSQIVDSRNYDQRNVYKEAPDDAPWCCYPPWPLALHHGQFWWVFFLNDEKQCTGLMLTSDILRAKPKD